MLVVISVITLFGLVKCVQYDLIHVTYISMRMFLPHSSVCPASGMTAGDIIVCYHSVVYNTEPKWAR
jgi:hypothetical protein